MIASGEARSLTPADIDSVAHLLVDPQVLQGPDGAVFLGPGAHHHLQRVLRVKDGETVTVTDGQGRWAETVVGKGFASGALEQTGGVRYSPRRAVELEVGFALTKADKPEWVIQKLTEIGISSIVPLAADRSVVRWDAERSVRNVERFQQIAREALQQSRRVWLPRISSPQSIDALVSGRLSAPSTSVGATPPEFVTDGLVAHPVARADRGGEPLKRFVARVLSPDTERIMVVIGPEGGWTDRERSILPGSVTVSDSVLRAETAAIVVAAYLVEAFEAQAT